jgi:hypothetical protein
MPPVYFRTRLFRGALDWPALYPALINIQHGFENVRFGAFLPFRYLRSMAGLGRSRNYSSRQY